MSSLDSEKPSNWPIWADAFLANLAKGNTVTKAAKLAKTHKQSAYLYRANEPLFAKLWQEAIDDSIEALEEEARKRAMKGSDTLLIFLLKARKPELYRENLKVEGHVTVNHVNDLSDDELLSIASRSGTGAT